MIPMMRLDFYEGLVWLFGCQFGKLRFEVENVENLCFKYRTEMLCPIHER